MTIFHNDRLVSELILPATNAAWLMGDGIFESLRTYNMHPFALNLHLQRLASSAERMKIPLPTSDFLRAAVKTVIDDNPHEPYGRLRITVLSDGELIITHIPYTQGPKTISLGRHPFSISSNLAITGLKTISYAENSLALRRAKERGFDDVIMVNDKGEVMESALANLIWFKDGSWWTPELRSGCLPGITRSLLLDHFGIREARLLESELTDVDALAITSSVREIVGIERYEDHRYSHSSNLEELRASFHSWILGNLLS